MKIMIITDAWDPQVNGVVRTLKQTRAELIGMGHEVEMITPNGFKSICSRCYAYCYRGSARFICPLLWGEK